MSKSTTLNKIRYITDKHGRNREVILPYKLFCELIELKETMETYKQQEVQKSIRKSKRQVREEKGKSFTEVSKAIQWLRE